MSSARRRCVAADFGGDFYQPAILNQSTIPSNRFSIAKKYNSVDPRHKNSPQKICHQRFTIKNFYYHLFFLNQLFDLTFLHTKKSIALPSLTPNFTPPQIRTISLNLHKIPTLLPNFSLSIFTLTPQITLKNYR